MVIDSEGVVRFANVAARALFEGTTRDLVGFHLGVPAILEPVELLLRRGSGMRHVEMRSCEILWEGRPASLASLRDLTAHRLVQQELRKRVAELHCLAELSRVVEIAGQEALAEDQLLDRAVRLLPPAWAFADDAVARIRFEGRTVETGDFASCVAAMCTELRVDGAVAGAIEVGYLGEHPPEDEGAFLAEERKLLDMLAERLGHVLWRMRSAATLREREQRYRLLAENMVDVLWTTNQDLELTYLNPAVRRVMGWAPEELIGTPLADCFEASAFEPLQAAIRRELDEAAGAAGVSLETEILHQDGSRVPVEFQGRVLRDDQGVSTGLQGTVRDLTERLRAQAERESLIASMAHTADSIMITDAEGAIEYVNPAFLRVTGYSRDEVIGENPRILNSGLQDPAFYRDLWETLRGGNTWRGQFVNRRKDGSTFTEDASISPVFDWEGNILRFVAVKRDISARLELEAQLRQSQKMESIGRLAGGVAHDFNNMLGVILGNAELALATLDLSHPSHASLEDIHAAAERAATLTRQLLAFARKQTIQPVVLDLNDTISGMLKLLIRLIGEDIHLVWKPASNLWSVRMDPGQLNQILANLVVNARDAIGGVGEVVLSTGNVGCERLPAVISPGSVAPASGSYVRLTVSDNGSGIAPETLAHIFEPFFTTKDRGQGTGLGLATVYGIVKQNQGYIDIASVPGQGTTFRLYLPRAEDLEALAEDAGAAAPQPPTGSETILLVEDEESLLRLSKHLLESLGYEVLATSDPDEALTLARAHAGRIDLLMTDVVMPRMNGADLRRQLGTELVPRCLFTSGYTTDIMSRRGVGEDEIHFLQKPFDVLQLARKVRQVLDG